MALHVDITEGLNVAANQGIFNTKTIDDILLLRFTWPGSQRAKQLRWALNQSLPALIAANSHTGTNHFEGIGGGSVPATTGWTGFVSSLDTIIIYVSDSAGSAGYDGLFPAFVSGIHGPKKTISDGALLLRDTRPDWLLLKRGDTFNNQVLNDGNTGRWQKSGRNAVERMVVGSYGAGSARPIINSSANNGFFSPAGFHDMANNFALIGLEFFASGNDGNYTNNGIIFFAGANNILIEDCKVRNYGSEGIAVTSNDGNNRFTNIVIRRNIISDTWTHNDYIGNGIYIGECDGILIEENICDSNGWSDFHSLVSGQQGPAHNMYIHNDNTNVVIRGNVVSNSDGIQLRSGGDCYNNLFLRNAISFEFGAGTVPNGGGVFGTTKGNVIIDGYDFPQSISGGSGIDPRGWGIAMGNCVNLDCGYNIIANNITGTQQRAIIPNFDNTGNPVNGMQNVDIHHNIVANWGADWSTQFSGSDGMVNWYRANAIVNNVSFRYNDIADTSATHAGQWLMAYTGVPLAGGSLEAQLHSNNNRYYRTFAGDSASAGTTFSVSGTSRTFNQFMSSIGDVTSRWELPVYTASGRTGVSYYSSTGGYHSITPTSSIQSYVSSLKLQAKSSWNAELMPTYGAVGPMIGGSYSRGSVISGPLRYLRLGFDMSGMGMSGISISPTSGAKAGGTPYTITGSGFLLGINSTSGANILIDFSTSSGTYQTGGGVILSDTSLSGVTPVNDAIASTIRIDNGDGISAMTSKFTFV